MLLIMDIAIVVKSSLTLRNCHVQILASSCFNIKKVRALSSSHWLGIDFLSVVLITHRSFSSMANIFDEMQEAKLFYVFSFDYRVN